MVSGPLFALHGSEQTCILLGLFCLETWRWKIGCINPIHLTKFSWRIVLRLIYGWTVKIKCNFEGTSIFEMFLDVTFWKCYLWPKRRATIAQKIASVVHDPCWHRLSRPLKCIFLIKIAKPCGHKSLHKEHFQPCAISLLKNALWQSLSC